MRAASSSSAGDVQGEAGEDLVEKQNAEQGLMPVVGNEAAEYGYEGENRYFIQCFLDGRQPGLDFHAGLEVTRLLMTCLHERRAGARDRLPAQGPGHVRTGCRARDLEALRGTRL